MTLNPLSNNRDLASCRKSWNRRPSIPQSSFSFVKRFHSVHLFTQKIGLSASWTTFPGALSCSVSAFNALLDKMKDGARCIRLSLRNKERLIFEINIVLPDVIDFPLPHSRFYSYNKLTF